MIEDQLLDDLITEAPNQVVESADLGRRFGNYLIDTILLQVAFQYLPLYTLVSFLPGNGWYYGYVFTVLYYVITEGFFGQSLGKLITGTVVVNEFGQKPKMGQLLIRALVRLIPLLDALSFLFSSEKRGWHDQWSKTYVIRKNSY